MKKIITTLSTIAVLVGSINNHAEAALAARGPIVPATGYPQWYEDLTGLRLDLCLDQNGKCLFALPAPVPPLTAASPAAVPGNLAGLPANWDPAGESFYYMASTSINEAQVDAFFEVALEAGFVGGVIQGGQSVFARIRMRINPRVPELANRVFTVVHPFGQGTMTTGAMNQNGGVTMDIPGLVAGDFDRALADGGLTFVGPLDARVNADGMSIGPFLRPTTAPVVDPVLGTKYLADPAVLVPVTGGPNGNAFTISAVLADGTTFSRTATLFSVQAKMSGCQATNTPPVAVADIAGAAAGVGTVINVLANDTAGTDPTTAPPATIPFDLASLHIPVLPTNGTVVGNPDGTVTYTPNAGFTGADTFSYMVLDKCGVTTAATPVSVTVANLSAARAEFRAKTGKWTVEGLSSALPGSAITVRKGAPLTGPIVGTTTVRADHTFKFVGKATVVPGPSPQNIAVESPANVTITPVLKMR